VGVCTRRYHVVEGEYDNLDANDGR
jgi:hypothetical protein